MGLFSIFKALRQQRASSRKEPEDGHVGTVVGEDEHLISAEPRSSTVSTTSSVPLLEQPDSQRRRRNAFSDGIPISFRNSHINSISATSSSESKTPSGSTESSGLLLDDQERFDTCLDSRRPLQAVNNESYSFTLRSPCMLGPRPQSSLSPRTKTLSISIPERTSDLSTTSFIAIPNSEESISLQSTATSEPLEDPKAPRQARLVSLPIPPSYQRLIEITSDTSKHHSRRVSLPPIFRMPFMRGRDDDEISVPSYQDQEVSMAASISSPPSSPVSAQSHISSTGSFRSSLSYLDLKDSEIRPEGTEQEGVKGARVGVSRWLSLRNPLRNFYGESVDDSVIGDPTSSRLTDSRSLSLFSRCRASQSEEGQYHGHGNPVIWSPDLQRESRWRQKLKLGRTVESSDLDEGDD